MEKLPAFIANHWALFAVLAAALAMLGFSLFGARLRGYRAIDPNEAIRILNRENGVALDLREAEAFAAGSVAAAVHAPQDKPDAWIGKLARFKGRPLILFCQSGNRSHPLCARLRKEGFAPIYTLSGGFAAWQNAGLPSPRPRKSAKKNAKR